MFDGGNVIAGFEQAGLRAGVEPGHTPRQKPRVQFILSEVNQIEIGNFELAACGWSQCFANLDYALVIHIETWNGVMAFWVFRFFFEADRTAVRSKFHDPVTLRIAHLITEDTGTFWNRQRVPVEIEFTVEDIVSENQRCAGIADKFCSDQKGLGDSLGSWLFRVFNA